MLLFFMTSFENLILQNKTYLDEFGRVHGIILIDKPANFTSHDIVNMARKYFNTKKIGHTGTLDPFATGLLILLVGKELKRAEELTAKSKKYIAEVLLGISTDSGDIEGEVLKISAKNLDKINTKTIDEALQSFQLKYNQFVPVFSSVKVKGHKLRELARNADSFEITNEKSNNNTNLPEDNSDKTKKELSKSVVFRYKDGKELKLNLPSRFVEVNIKLVDTFEIKFNDVIEKYFKQKNLIKPENTTNLTVLRIEVECSKGTYIRQLAVDIGERVGNILKQKEIIDNLELSEKEVSVSNTSGIPAVLISLRRTQVGEFEVGSQ